MIDLLDELHWRGLFHQATDEAALREHLGDPANSPRLVYAGFDPTADSLTIGNLVPILLLKHFQLAGHTPVVVMGGGTGLIGDPSGKEAERLLRTPEEIEQNISKQTVIFKQILSFEGKNAAIIVNNLDWLSELNYLEVLRDVGKHFSVNMMIQKDSVKARLTGREQGISYTEFSYMILQAYDFLCLYGLPKKISEQDCELRCPHCGCLLRCQDCGCLYGLPNMASEHVQNMLRGRSVTVQVGGSDQWGNIVAGCDLIRRVWYQITAQDVSIKNPEYKEQLQSEKFTEHIFETQTLPSDKAVFGLTAPLVTKSDGGKYGKTEQGTIWLTAARTSPYAFYQHWLNTTDADIGCYLRLSTLLGRDEITLILAEHTTNPGTRMAQRTLAQELTRLIHGESELERAEAAAAALFSGDVASLDLATLNEVFADVPSSEHKRADLTADGVALVELLPMTTLAKSKREAREFLSNGAVSVNGEKMNLDSVLTADHLLHGSVALIRRGKKTWHVTRWG